MWQPSSFRYSADAFWLAGFALEGPATTALDLGTGSGIVAFLLARAGIQSHGIDDESRWAAGWEKSNRGSRVQVDFRCESVLDVVQQVDLVTSNPPYFPRHSGPVASDPLRAAARTEGSAKLEDFLGAAARCLSATGRAAFVVPTSRVDAVQHPELVVRRRTFVGSKRVLVGLRRESGPCVDLKLTREQARRFYPS